MKLIIGFVIGFIVAANICGMIEKDRGWDEGVQYGIWYANKNPEKRHDDMIKEMIKGGGPQ